MKPRTRAQRQAEAAVLDEGQRDAVMQKAWEQQREERDHQKLKNQFQERVQDLKTLEQVAAEGGEGSDEARHLVAQQREKLERAQQEHHITLDSPKKAVPAEPKHEPGYIPPPAAFSDPGASKTPARAQGPSAPVSSIFGGEQDAGLFAAPRAVRAAPVAASRSVPDGLQHQGNNLIGASAAAPPWEMAPAPAPSNAAPWDSVQHDPSVNVSVPVRAEPVSKRDEAWQAKRAAALAKQRGEEPQGFTGAQEIASHSEAPSAHANASFFDANGPRAAPASKRDEAWHQKRAAALAKVQAEKAGAAPWSKVTDSREINVPDPPQIHGHGQMQHSPVARNVPSVQDISAVHDSQQFGLSPMAPQEQRWQPVAQYPPSHQDLHTQSAVQQSSPFAQQLPTQEGQVVGNNQNGGAIDAKKAYAAELRAQMEADAQRKRQSQNQEAIPWDPNVNMQQPQQVASQVQGMQPMQRQHQIHGSSPQLGIADENAMHARPPMGPGPSSSDLAEPGQGGLFGGLGEDHAKQKERLRKQQQAEMQQQMAQQQQQPRHRARGSGAPSPHAMPDQEQQAAWQQMAPQYNGSHGSPDPGYQFGPGAPAQQAQQGQDARQLQYGSSPAYAQVTPVAKARAPQSSLGGILGGPSSVDVAPEEKQARKADYGEELRRQMEIDQKKKQEMKRYWKGEDAVGPSPNAGAGSGPGTGPTLAGPGTGAPWESNTHAANQMANPSPQTENHPRPPRLGLSEVDAQAEKRRQQQDDMARVLQEQIAEKERKKELEKQKLKEEDEKLEARIREEAEKERLRNEEEERKRQQRLQQAAMPATSPGPVVHTPNSSTPSGGSGSKRRKSPSTRTRSIRGDSTPSTDNGRPPRGPTGPAISGTEASEPVEHVPAGIGDLFGPPSDSPPAAPPWAAAPASQQMQAPPPWQGPGPMAGAGPPMGAVQQGDGGQQAQWLNTVMDQQQKLYNQQMQQMQRLQAEADKLRQDRDDTQQHLLNVKAKQVEEKEREIKKLAKQVQRQAILQDAGVGNALGGVGALLGGLDDTTPNATETNSAPMGGVNFYSKYEKNPSSGGSQPCAANHDGLFDAPEPAQNAGLFARPEPGKNDHLFARPEPHAGASPPLPNHSRRPPRPQESHVDLSQDSLAAGASGVWSTAPIPWLQPDDPASKASIPLPPFLNQDIDEGKEEAPPSKAKLAESGGSLFDPEDSWGQPLSGGLVSEGLANLGEQLDASSSSPCLDGTANFGGTLVGDSKLVNTEAGTTWRGGQLQVNLQGAPNLKSHAEPREESLQAGTLDGTSTWMDAAGLPPSHTTNQHRVESRGTTEYTTFNYSQTQSMPDAEHPVSGVQNLEAAVRAIREARGESAAGPAVGLSTELSRTLEGPRVDMETSFSGVDPWGRGSGQQGQGSNDMSPRSAGSTSKGRMGVTARSDGSGPHETWGSVLRHFGGEEEPQTRAKSNSAMYNKSHGESSVRISQHGLNKSESLNNASRSVGGLPEGGYGGNFGASASSSSRVPHDRMDEMGSFRADLDWNDELDASFGIAGQGALGTFGGAGNDGSFTAKIERHLGDARSDSAVLNDSLEFGGKNSRSELAPDADFDAFMARLAKGKAGDAEDSLDRVARQSGESWNGARARDTSSPAKLRHSSDDLAEDSLDRMRRSATGSRPSSSSSLRPPLQPGHGNLSPVPGTGIGTGAPGTTNSRNSSPLLRSAGSSVLRSGSADPAMRPASGGGRGIPTLQELRQRRKKAKTTDEVALLDTHAGPTGIPLAGPGTSLHATLGAPHATCDAEGHKENLSLEALRQGEKRAMPPTIRPPSAGSHCSTADRAAAEVPSSPLSQLMASTGSAH